MNKIRVMLSVLIVFVLFMIIFQITIPSTTSKKLKLDLHIKQQQQQINNSNKHLNNINSSNNNQNNQNNKIIDYNFDQFDSSLKEYIQNHNNSFIIKSLKKKPKLDFYQGLYSTFKTQAFYSKASGITNMVSGQLYRNYFVSIVTQTTVDRLHKVSMMADKWKAPMSVSVFIKRPDHDLPELKKKLQNYPSLLYYADLHLLYSNNTRYPVNNLRNLAINNSRTDFVFIMDADFLPPLGLHDYISSQKHYFKINKSNQDKYKSNLLNFNLKKPQLYNNNKYQDNSNNNNSQDQDNSSSSNNNNNNNNSNNSNKIIYNQSIKKNNNDFISFNNININNNNDDNNNNNNNNINNNINNINNNNNNNNAYYNTNENNEYLKVAFVVPSFSSSEPPEFLPDDKEEMIEMIDSNKVTPSNINVCKKCHSPTNYSKWNQSIEPYEIEYKWIFEPYLIFNKSQGIPFDERLKGYGFDKNSHAFSMAVEGFHFVVLPESFIIHVNHKSSSWEGPSLDEQQWDALRIVCDIIPEIKLKNNYNINEQLFDEPLEDECYSDSHW